ncbi:Cys-Gln thioester bond-forming surface protein [Streptomyces roseicoloratus]|uniref:Cys-Gln thioester bond-forming surface protein n=1 Tax=Streptomyces roseicoloratus TaxID=2508722 RepID=A0ABY9RXZ3_9ACTN|nr:Cys-Gln thioester bond-forming surface protein [Streptomyces roseicoloratus]WMX47043.1 Cys-Gln thioester bond-forming surface protein [Streptomyces roseicoloratus]
MFSVQRRGAARLAAATVVSGLVVAGSIAIAGPAVADDKPAGTGGATATLGDLKIFDDVVIKGKKDRKVSAGLFEMTVKPGGSIQTYCIDLYTGAKTGEEYKEVGWDQSSLHNNKDAGKIRWILQNSYPQVNDLEILAKKAGASKLSKETAAAATQAAIWHFSDKVNAVPEDAEAAKLTEYLEKSAVELSEPAASLSLSPSSVAGKAGGRLGPVTVDTNAATAKVSLAPGAPAGVKIVDKDGKVVTDVTKGSQVYFDVPAGTEGSAELTVQADTTVPIGRAFVATRTKSQTLILAGTSTSTVSAKASATWVKQGAAPFVTAEKNCAKGGVDVTLGNKGDQPWELELKGMKHSIAPGESKTVTVPVAEDEAYKFTITGPNGFEQVIEGVLDCKTATPGPTPSETPTDTPSPSQTPATGGTTSGSTTGGGDLAETGSSNATPMIAGVAVALLVVGGGAVFFLRKKKTVGQ